MPVFRISGPLAWSTRAVRSNLIPNCAGSVAKGTITYRAPEKNPAFTKNCLSLFLFLFPQPESPICSVAPVIARLKASNFISKSDGYGMTDTVYTEQHWRSIGGRMACPIVGVLA